MSQLFKNAARAALTAPIGAADTSLTIDITKADLFPAADTGSDPVPTVGKDFYKIVIEDVNHNIEIAYVRTRTLGSATMSNLLRGQEGTTAISFAVGSVVGLRHTSVDLEKSIDLAAQATTPGKDLLWAPTVNSQVQKLGSALQSQLVQAFTTTGTSTAYEITPTPPITAYAANLSFDITFDEACGAAPTLAISGLATPPNLVKQLVDGSYANLEAGDIVANHRSRVTLLSPTQALVERLPHKFSNYVPDIASAAILQLENLDGDIAIVTGTIAVGGMTMNNGQRVTLLVAAALPLTYHSTNLPLPGGVSRTCEAGDMIIATKSRTGTLHIQFIPINGEPLAIPANFLTVDDLGPNVIRNGSFEQDELGWTIVDFTGGSHAIDTSNDMDGAKALGFTSTSTANGGGEAINGEYIPITGGEGIDLKFAIKASVANVSAKVEAIWYDDAQAQISVSTLYTSASAPTTLTGLVRGAAAPSTARFVRIKLTGGVPGSGSATGSIYFDGVRLSKSDWAEAGDYIVTDPVGGSSAGGLTLKGEFVSPKSGVFRTHMTLSNSSSGFTHTGRIYKNGAAFGTNRTTASSSGGSVTFTEDLAFSKGDLIQIYVGTSGDPANASLRLQEGSPNTANSRNI